MRRDLGTVIKIEPIISAGKMATSFKTMLQTIQCLERSIRTSILEIYQFQFNMTRNHLIVTARCDTTTETFIQKFPTKLGYHFLY